VPERSVVAVRPDGYLGFRSNTLDLEHLRAWLGRIGALPEGAGVLAIRTSATGGD
jgi:hypothetical protein